MVYKFQPLRIGMKFDDRTYRLGETVDITVILTPSKDVSVRSARVELLCEQRYVRWEGMPTVVSGARLSQTSLSQGGGMDSRTEPLVHSGVRFLDETMLSASGDHEHPVQLNIATMVPPRVVDAKLLQRDASRGWSFEWFLVLSVDVRMGRNSSGRRKITISGF